MKIGIIVYSQTEHTLSACEKIKMILESNGHTAAIDRVEISGDPAKGASAITLTKSPDPSIYDGVIFASPVQAFSLAIPMKKYLDGISGLSGKRIVCFVTKQLPFRWTGGSHALSQMSGLCLKAGSKPVGSSMVIWSSKNLEADIDAAAAEVAGFFGS